MRDERSALVVDLPGVDDHPDLASRPHREDALHARVALGDLLKVEGPHALVGGKIARRLGETEAVAHAMEAHHNEVEPRTVEAVIVQASDALSGARPGARGDSLEQYVGRLRDLEEIAMRHQGVERVFAMRAGREIRVIVDPGEVDDDRAAVVSHEIAKAVESEMEFPGRIRITVIRETRATSFAD